MGGTQPSSYANIHSFSTDNFVCFFKSTTSHKTISCDISSGTTEKTIIVGQQFDILSIRSTDGTTIIDIPKINGTDDIKLTYRSSDGIHNLAVFIDCSNVSKKYYICYNKK